jgi:hypothetical protein
VSDLEREEAVPTDGAIELECGHRIVLPWGTDPAVAAAVMVHHRTDCVEDARTGAWTLPPPWAILRPEPTG